jgi:hypothetical protein
LFKGTSLISTKHEISNFIRPGIFHSKGDGNGN